MARNRTRAFWVETADYSEDLIRKIVYLHADVLPEDLTAMLGLALRMNIFSRLVEQSGCVVAMDGEKVVGFCILSKSSILRSALLSAPISFCWDLINISIRRPDRIFEILQVIFRAALGRSINLNYATEIFSFGVSPDKQSQGIGSEILTLASDKYRGLGILTKTSDARAAQFYQNNGFQVVGEERRGNRVLKVLLRDPSASVHFDE